MNGLPYYKRYPRDFIEGTIALPFEVKTTYAFILDLIYMQGGTLPDDPRYIAGLLSVSVRKWNSLRQQLIDYGKIQVSGEFLTNYRAIIELESLAKVQDKQRENRSRPNKNKDLQTPRSHHTDTDTDKKEDTNVSSKKRGQRLPEDWRLPKAWGEWAVAQGLDDFSARREGERFADYWHGVSGARGAKMDWQATWRNWVRKALDERTPRSQIGKPKDGEVRDFNGVRKVYHPDMGGWVREYA